MYPRKVPDAPALRHEFPAGAQRREQTREQALVIEHPVECRRTKDDVDPLLKWQRGNVGDDGTRVGERPERFRGDVDHGRRFIYRDDKPITEPLGQQRGQPSCTRAGVHGDFVASELESREDLLSPLELRF